jgi:hypothetical protein
LLKARNKKLSLLIVFAMLMTMFAGVGVASANTTTYSCLQVPYLSTNTEVRSSDATLGTIVVDWDTLAGKAEAEAHKAILVLPEGLEFTNTSGVRAQFVKGDGGTANVISKIRANSKKEVDISVYGTTVIDARMLIYLENIKVTDSAPTGEAQAQFLNIRGLFPQGKVTIGNVVGTGAASISIIETQTFTGGKDQTIELTVQESTAKGVKDENRALTFKLPRGFSWVGDVHIDNLTSNNVEGFGFDKSDDKRTLYLNRNNSNLDRSLFKITATVSVDETLATFGDVDLTINGKNTVTPSTLKIGSFADYGYTITVTDPEKEILAGRSALDSTTQDEAQLSEFFIAETINGSLLNNRTIYMELPEGVQWYHENMTMEEAQNAINNSIDTSTENGGIQLEFVPVQNKPGMIKGTFSNINEGGAKDKIKITAKVVVAVDFEGDVTIKFSGSQGINDTITVAKVIKPVTAKADIVDVKIGLQAQDAGDIVINEVKSEVFVHTGNAALTVTAPAGVSFYELPDVEVVEGDVLLGTVTLSRGEDGTRNNVLRIPIRSSSDKASSIKISNVSYSLDRTVPEGDLVLDIGGCAVDRAGITNRTVAATVIAANCITPAPGETIGNGEFRIGSNIYYVGGVAKVMDVAPYIKGDRTYVPMRYLGEILGAEVVWDGDARTVTLTRGDDVVVFTIGSTVYTVNGESMTADVAPEIANDRTMLPARFVAEAFGAVVGWDAATRTVLIQK